MASQRDMGELLASDDEVLPLKSRVKSKATEERVTIILEENDNIPPTGQFIQFGAGNSLRSFVLRPGEEASVPKALLHVLDQAVQDVPQIDPTTRQVVGYRKKLRFPYRVITATATA